MKHLTDEAAQATINLLLHVRYSEAGSNALKNAGAIIAQLEVVEEPIKSKANIPKK